MYSNLLGKNRNVIILMGLVAGLAMPMAAQPRIFYTDLDSGPNAGGENNQGAFVTIYGKGFGSSGQVTVGGGRAASYPIWTDTKVAFQLGSAAASGNIVVTAAAGTSNGLPFTVRPGNLYFVATNGNDANAGTSAAPWKTMLHARDSMKAGDITYVKDGVSQTNDDGQGWDTTMLIQTGGTAGLPVALVAYPGATATIGNINGPSSGIRSKDQNASYWVIAGFTLRGQNEAATTYGSAFWKVVGNDMSCPNGDFATACFETGVSSNIQFYGNNVHDTGKASASALYQGVYFSTDSNHLDIGWNGISNVHGCRGLQIHSSPLQGGGPSDPTGHDQYDISIHDNVIHDTQCDGIILATIDPSKGKVEIFNNVIYNAGKGPNNPEASGNWSCINAQSWTNTGPSGSGTVEIYNNTFANCGTFANPPYQGGNNAVSYSGPNGNINVHLRNNIFYQPAGIPYVAIERPGASACADTESCPWVYGSNNLFFGNGPGPGNPSITNSINSDPLFASAAQNDYHIGTGSPAAFGGTVVSLAADLDGTPVPSGGGYSIGAYAAKGGSAPPPTVSASISPASITLNGGQAQTFTATVSGSANTGVSWSISPIVGTLAGGTYTAPAVVLSAQTVVITVTSLADPSKSSRSTVTLVPISVTGLTGATLNPGQSKQFSATVAGTSNPSLNWSLSPATGSVSASGLYTAPASVSSQQSITIRAASALDATKFATATITLMASPGTGPGPVPPPPPPPPQVTISVNPKNLSLSTGQTQQFVASVTGTSNTAVTWSLSPAVGALSPKGLYTAPASLPGSTTVTIKAACVSDPSMNASAAVTVTPVVQPPSSSFSANVSVVGNQFKVSWTAPAGRPAGDWLGLSSSEAPGWWTIWTGAIKGTSGSLTIPKKATDPGTFEVRYFNNGTYDILAKSAPVQADVAGFSVTPASTVVTRGSQLAVSWTAGSGRSQSDVIGLYSVGSASDGPSWWIPTNGAASGKSHGWPVPSVPGTYEFRYIRGGGYLEVVKSGLITIQ